MTATPPPAQEVQDIIDLAYRRDSRRVFATLVRLLGDFDVAEEALHDAFRAAIERWPTEGVPANPSAWLVSTGRFKAIDRLRRQKRFRPWDEVAEQAESIADVADMPEERADVEDDRLRLIFTCCHPSLAEEAQIALTLREVCGLTTEEIARAFLLPAPTLAQRIVRAKTKIRAARIPYEVPDRESLPRRLRSVLRVIYLVFNEGYSASSGTELTRRDVSDEAIRLARLLHDLLPDPEVLGLLALMLLNEARRAARADANGDLVPLEEQDRAAWNAELIREGCALTRRALETGPAGPYGLQAAISALHGEAERWEDTDWAEIRGLYDLLLRTEPSPVVELNRAAAVAMHEGLEAGLRLVDALLARGELADYHLAHAARADLCRRLGRRAEARAAYARALECARQAPERRFLARRLAALDAAADS
jgi:RNA polymerase sigma-70 factor (ECF subfamily)